MPRCANCKEKFEVKYFSQKYCMTKDECIAAFVQSNRQNQIKKAQKQKKEWNKKALTVQDYIKKAKPVFQKWIRNRDKNQNCISCGKPLKIGNIDGGHYFSAGGHSNVMFNEDNCHAQCSRPCNKDKAGDLINYRNGLIERIGIERLEALEVIARLEKKWTIDELKEIIKKYKC